MIGDELTHDLSQVDVEEYKSFFAKGVEEIGLEATVSSLVWFEELATKLVDSKVRTKPKVERFE
jgi:hypothetical protein